MDIISSTHQTAKKEHRCSYCYGFIHVSEKYHRQALKYDDFYIWKSHIRCEKLAHVLNMFDNCDEGVTSDDFQEFISEKYKELNPDLQFYTKDFQERLDFVWNNLTGQK